MKLKGWKFEGEPPAHTPRYVMVGAPHTSNWDFILCLAMIVEFDLPLKFMIKEEVFRWPFAGLMKALGGVPVNRTKGSRANQVHVVADALAEQDRAVIGILPEGTRKYVDHWKSGFYYIALYAKVPMVLVKVDGPSKTLTLGPALWPSGNLDKDMQTIANYYEGVKGIVPENTGEVILPQGKLKKKLEERMKGQTDAS